MKTTLGLFRTGRSTGTAAVVFIVIALVLLFYPFQTTIVPEWSLRVVDEEGAAVRNVNVTEHWQHFLLESLAHEDVRQVSENGAVSFPERTIRASVVSRGLATISRIKRDGWRARRSPAASVVVWGNPGYATTVAVYFPSALPQSHVIVPTIR
jgi:hypothetical protein